MNVVEKQRMGAVVWLSEEELLIISNALNEVCHGLDVPEFATRIGADRPEAERLLRAILALHDGIQPT